MQQAKEPLTPPLSPEYRGEGEIARGGSTRVRITIVVTFWLIAIASAAALDRTVAEHVRSSGSDAWLHGHKAVQESLKAMGFYPFTVLVASIVAMVNPQKWRAAAFVLFSTLTAALNELSKWVAGRARPFKSFTGDISAARPFDWHPFPPMGSKNLSFPSGHAALAFATATALSILWPRQRWIFYVLATAVAAERVLENAHWLSDAVSAMALGIGGVTLVYRAVRNSGLKT